MRKSSSSTTDPATTRPTSFALSPRKIPRCAWWKIPAIAARDTACATACSTARGRIVLFSDADLSSPIEEAPKLFQALDAGADIAIGSRWLRAETQTQRQPLHRQLFGRIYNLILRLTLGLQFADTQCGFKAFKQTGGSGNLPAAENRALGIRSRDSLPGEKAEIQSAGSLRRLGTQRRNPHQSRWSTAPAW